MKALSLSMSTCRTSKYINCLLQMLMKQPHYVYHKHGSITPHIMCSSADVQVGEKWGTSNANES